MLSFSRVLQVGRRSFVGNPSKIQSTRQIFGGGRIFHSKATGPSLSSSLQHRPSARSPLSILFPRSETRILCPNELFIAPIRGFSSELPKSPNPTTATVPPISSFIELLNAYSSLTKFKLSSLVILTTMMGYVLAPTPFHLSTFLASSVGTSFAVFSASAFNQVIEIEKDKLMSRTLKRILPTGKITVGHAIALASVLGVTGVSLLYYQVNSLSAVLALSNIIMYTLVYTPLKQIHPINTWVGGIVGSIPPMIGWASATGGLEAGAWVLAAALYIWQIPHFLSLSWSLREDYKRAGYKMLSVTDPPKVPIETFRWSLLSIPLGFFSWLTGLTTPFFIFDSNLVNAYLIYHSYRFYQTPTNLMARKAFMSSVWYLPLLLLLMIVHKTDKEKKDDDEEQEQIEAKN